MTEHQRGWNTDFSHQRKFKSYEIETNWYEQWNKLTTTDCKTPEFLGSFKKGNEQWIILEDLDASYPIRKQELTFAEVKVCLKKG